jgi:adenosine/AMP kinase
MDIQSVTIEKPEEINFILGQSHFIKTVEDLEEVMVNTSPHIKFGIAFCEASGECLVRWTGNDEELTELAKNNAFRIGAGHSFIIFLREAFPLNVLNSIMMTCEVCNIFCATANPTEVLIVENESGRGIIGVIDGQKPRGIEGIEGKKWRHGFLRMIGYKADSPKDE